MTTHPNGDTPTVHNGWAAPLDRVGPSGAMPEIQPEDRDVVKGILRSRIQKWCEHTNAGVDKNERNAMRNWARAMGVAGGMVEVNIALQINNALGMPLERAQKLIGLAQSVEGLEDIDAVSIMEQHVREFYRQRGKRLVILDEAEEVA